VTSGALASFGEPSTQSFTRARDSIKLHSAQ
jgi:hypothetical protein